MRNFRAYWTWISTWAEGDTLKDQWEGRYFDGKTSAAQRAVVRPLQSGLSIELGNGTQLLWPYREIKQAQGHFEGEPVRLERGQGLSEALILQDLDFLNTLRAQSRSQARRFHDPGFRRTRFWLVVQAGLACLVVAFAFYHWGIPYLAAKTAQRVPLSWEEGLGESQATLLAPPDHQVHDPELDRAIQRIVSRISTGMAPTPYKFHVIVSDLPIFNAMALPGGSIVVFTQLLKSTRSPEELAGVLAHEMQHVVRRHITKRVIEDSSTGLLITVLSGDATGSAAYGLESAKTLALMAYSRSDEEEADREGMKAILASGIDPQGMLHFFETLKKKMGGKEFKALKYLGTHPLTDERIQKLKELVASAGKGKGSPPKKAVTALLPGVDWAALVGSAGKSR